MIDRRIYRRKYDARKTLATFNSRFREETDLDSLDDEVLGVVRETMQPEHVSLWLRTESAPIGSRAYLLASIRVSRGGGWVAKSEGPIL